MCTGEPDFRLATYRCPLGIGIGIDSLLGHPDCARSRFRRCYLVGIRRSLANRRSTAKNRSVKKTVKTDSRIPVGLACAAALVLAACGAEDQTGEYYTHWDEGGGCTNPRGTGPMRISATGEKVDVCAHRGEFVWIGYVAPWCSASAAQAPELRSAARQAPQNAHFVVSLTSGSEPFVPATDGDVRDWADRHGLDPRIVTREGHSIRTLPQHALIGPDGWTWFRYVGQLSQEEILQLLADFQDGRREPKRFD